MFRNPRADGSLTVPEPALPSTGRPPTPPTNYHGSPTDKSPFFHSASPSASGPSRTMQQASPPSFSVLGPGKMAATKITSSSRKTSKQNQSILSFFSKSEKISPDASAAKAEFGLFFDESPRNGVGIQPSVISETESFGRSCKDELRAGRFNEMQTPVKRRRISDEHQDEDFVILTPNQEPHPPPDVRDTGNENNRDQTMATAVTRKPTRQRGGFVEDSSDDEDRFVSRKDQNNHTESIPLHEAIDRKGEESGEQVGNTQGSNFIDFETTSKVLLKEPDQAGETLTSTNEPDHPIPALSREGTSMFTPVDFDENEEFENDEFFEEGEEYMERRWMEEQRELEMGLDEDFNSESCGESIMTPKDDFDGITSLDDDQNVPTCPICSGSLHGLSETQASSHVNACLDGTASTLQTLEQGSQHMNKCKDPVSDAALQPSVERAPLSGKRFQLAAIARPGQSNPFASAKNGKSGGSAFTRLMSGHAEDAAWAEAASNEAQSRGKPAYQRTCPFYKIMPGLYICVDAFRYGKVEGQNAYFLSHFHSDHYIGLTSTWCHGPIYASKVTCNLMRQQLRVDPKWVFPLEFEKKVEVPNTKGVFVTMIPANHCPGSSLFLFEKVTGKSRDGSPKMNRVLHCGDFRACPAHVTHPLLRPDIVDAISGQTKQQSIDTCYLDTTYLTPKYSFPSQHDVIDACAQMCVSLSKEIPDNDDDWEKVKLERAGSTMTKFLEQGEKNSEVKEENKTEDIKPKVRGRLLVVIGTYSIGKERICLGIAKALNSKIFAPPAKMKICACLEDEELNALLTNNPYEAQVHMQTLMEIRAETLHDYLVTYRGHFQRVVGFRPTGWSYRPPTSRFTENPAVNTVLHSEGWKSRFTMRDLAPQRGSTRESNCFGVPYSEHSSFRELTMFCCALRIARVVPTVNVGSAKSREKMKGWIEKWDVEKRKNGLFKIEDEDGSVAWGGDSMLRYGI